MSYTTKQMSAIAEFCGYATKVNPEGDRIRPDDLIIHEKLHNDDSTDGRLDLSVIALTPDIVVRGTIDCYGNVSICDDCDGTQDGSIIGVGRTGNPYQERRTP